MRVLVTGASGFLGGHLARSLRGVGAVGASRSPSADQSIEWVSPFDPSKAWAARQALEGVDVVLHAAGRAHVIRETSTDPLAAFREANVTPTRVLRDAALQAGVRRFILLSSVSVYGDQKQGTVGAETSTSPTTPYGESRLEAEQVLRESKGIETVILRLPMVYGPGMKGNPLRLFDLVSRRIPLPLGSITNARSIVYVGNVVEVVRGLLNISVPSGTILLLADAEPVSTPSLTRSIAAALSISPRILPCPLPLLRLVARAGNQLLGSRFPLGPDALWRLESSLVLDTAPTRRLLGPPRYALAEGLAETAAWYRTRA